jgi:hypothetical protein
MRPGCSWLKIKAQCSNDYFGYELNRYGKKADVFIAVAFFTDSIFVRNYVNNIAMHSYPTIRNNLASKSRIESLGEEEIRETACIIHAFNAQLRFHHGGK